MKIETLALSVTCLLAKFGVAAKTVNMASPLADGTIEFSSGVVKAS